MLMLLRKWHAVYNSLLKLAKEELLKLIVLLATFESREDFV